MRTSGIYETAKRALLAVFAFGLITAAVLAVPTGAASAEQNGTDTALVEAEGTEEGWPTGVLGTILLVVFIAIMLAIAVPVGWVIFGIAYGMLSEFYDILFSRKS